MSNYLYMCTCRTLVLKDFGIAYLLPLLKNIKVSRIRLKRLDLHYLDAFPGISIEEIDFLCPDLEQLTICDSLLTWSHDPVKRIATQGKNSLSRPCFCRQHKNRPCLETDHFRKMKICKLYRVNYEQPEDWTIFLRFATNLKSLHLESSRNMTDSSFQSILMDHDLTNLEVQIYKSKYQYLESKQQLLLQS